MKHPLASSIRKIARAKRHLAELEGEILDFINTCTYRVVTERDPQNPQQGICKLKFSRGLPETIVDIAGDVVGNLRASLDRACYGIAVAAGNPNPTQAYFPFSTDSRDFESKLKGRCAHIPPDVYPFFRVLQPYKGGNDILHAMNKVTIMDKHLTVIPVGNMASTNLFRIQSNNGFFSAPTSHVWDNSKNEIELFRGAGEVKYDYDFSIYICITGFQAIEGEPVDGVLREFVRMTEDIVDGLESVCIRLGYI